MIELTSSVLIVYGFLSVSILAVWYKPPIVLTGSIQLPLWLIFLCVSVSFGLIYQILKPGAVFYLAGLALSCYVVKTPRFNIYLRFVFAVITLIMVIVLFLHKAPFFNNPLVFDQFFKSPGSAEYSKYWNYDKAASGLILLVFFGDLSAGFREFIQNTRKIALISISTIFIVISLSVAFSYIAFDVSFTIAYLVWAWANLFFTCVSEEMLFRGFVQKHLLKKASHELKRIMIVVFVGILFGLAHFAGGATYVILAAIAGTGYGLAYYKTGKIEFAILTHFLLNSIHFIFFSYPFIRPVA